MNTNAAAEISRHPDSDLIESLGGSAAVARKLGFDPGAGGSQRVQNWKYRGIPELIRLKRPDVFDPPAKRQKARAA